MWPLQSELDSFYGNPRGRMGKASSAWESTNLIRVPVPFRMTYAGKPVSAITIHNKCANSLTRILAKLAEHSPAELKAAGVNIFGGSYNYRLMRNSNRLSVHAYGAAIDLDPARNAFHDLTPNLENYLWVVKAFEDEGWEWGGRWSGRDRDGMHFQAARVE